MASRFCVHCGTAIEDGQNFCINCGAPAYAPQPQYIVQQVPVMVQKPKGPARALELPL